MARRKAAESGADTRRRKYDAARVRPVLVFIPAAAAALTFAACGSEGIQVAEDDPTHEGAVLFAERCSGCHTLSAAGTQGSGNNSLRNQGPNFDQRQVSYEDALFAIRNGGFSGAIMPQNIVVGDDAEAVARFLEEWSGGEAESALAPAEGEEAPPPGGEEGSAPGSGAEQ
jgi:mono/diheme cytochrome c family protein